MKMPNATSFFLGSPSFRPGLAAGKQESGCVAELCIRLRVEWGWNTVGVQHRHETGRDIRQQKPLVRTKIVQATILGVEGVVALKGVNVAKNVRRPLEKSRPNVVQERRKSRLGVVGEKGGAQGVGVAGRRPENEFGKEDRDCLRHVGCWYSKCQHTKLRVWWPVRDKPFGRLPGLGRSRRLRYTSCVVGATAHVDGTRVCPDNHFI